MGTQTRFAAVRLLALLVFLPALFSCFAPPASAAAAHYNCSSEVRDGFIQYNSGVWPPNRMVLVPDINTTQNFTRDERSMVSGAFTSYRWSRGFLSVDCSWLPNAASLINATLYYNITEATGTTDSQMYSGQNCWGAALDEFDWDACGTYEGDFGVAAIPGYYSMPITTTSVNVTGRTQFRFILVDESAQPGEENYLDICSADKDSMTTPFGDVANPLSYWLQVYYNDSIQIDSCRELNESGMTYNLNKSVSAAGICFNITANNVTLDCQGYAINYSASISGYAVNVSYSLSNITIKNCVIQQSNCTLEMDQTHGIYFNATMGGLVYNNSLWVSGANTYGVYVEGNPAFNGNNNISSNVVRGYNYVGIELGNANNNTVENNVLNSSCGIISLDYVGVGFGGVNGNQNVIRNNVVYSTGCTMGVTGIYLWSQNSVVSNNSITLYAPSGVNRGLDVEQPNNAFFDNNVSCSGGTAGMIRGVRVSQSNNSFTRTLVATGLSGSPQGDFVSDDLGVVNVTVVNMTFNSSGNPVLASFVLSGSVVLKSVDSFPSDPSGYSNISKYLNVTNSSAAWVYLNVSYNDSDWQNARVISENSLSLWKYNASGWSRVAGGGVDTVRNYVYANLTSFSDFGPLGELDVVNVTLNAPLNATWNSSRSINFTFTPFTYTVFANCSLLLWWYNNGSSLATVWNTSNIINNTANKINYTFANDGAYSWNVECWNNASTPTSNQSIVNWTVFIDATPPSVRIDAPANASTYNAVQPLTINVTANDSGAGLDKAVTNSSLWAGVFSPDGNYFNLSNSSALTAGLKCVNVTVNDSLGNSNYSYACFTFSTSPYFVNITSPSALNNSWFAQRYLNFSGICNSSVTPLVNVTLDYNGTRVANASTVLNATTFYFNQSVASDGYYYFNITCYSTNELSNSSPNWLFKIDATPPSNLVFVDPTPPLNSWINLNYSFINLTFVEANPDSCLLTFTYSNGSAANWLMTRSGTNCFLNVTSQPDGQSIAQVVVNDSADNPASATTQFYVDTASPRVSLVSPADGNVTTQRNATFSFNYTDALSPTANCSLYFNSTLNATNASAVNATTTNFSVGMGDGNWTWNVSCFDLAGNWNSSANRSVFVNTTPTLYGITVYDVTQTSATVSFLSDEPTTDWVWFIGDGNTTESSVYAVSHAVSLGGLTPNTLYTVRGCGADVLNNSNCSDVASFTTLPGGGPTPTPSATPTPTPSSTPTPTPTATPTPSGTPTPTSGPGPTEPPSPTISMGSEVAELNGAISEVNSTICRAGESADVVVNRTIEVLQTPNGVLTRVTLVVSNHGKAAAFGVSVSEFVDSLARGERVEYAVAPQRFFDGGAEWVIDVLPPGASREFSYAVFRRASPSEIAGARPPVVFVKSASVVSASFDYTLLYAAAMLLAASLAARLLALARKRKEKESAKSEAESEKSEKKSEEKTRPSRGSNWLLVVGVVVVVLVLAAAYLIYLSTLQPQTPPRFEPTSQPSFAASPPPLPPAAAETPTVEATTSAPSSEAQSAECVLYRNRYTSEFKCIACAIQAGTEASQCIYASRDWTRVPSGTSGYYCQYDEILALKCRTLKS